MQGQTGYFEFSVPENIPYAKNRYINETKRLEIRLKDRDYLAGPGPGRGKFSLADIKPFPWIRMHASVITPTLDEFLNVKAWVQRLDKQAATVAGLKVPE